MDQRDERTWVAIELSHLGLTKVEDGTLTSSLRQDLGLNADFPIFVPAATYIKGARTVTLHLMEGYVFVASGLTDTSYFALERKPYIAKVMSAPSGPYRIRALSVIPDKHIEELRKQLQQMVSSDISEGDQVFVTKGTYRGLDGSVVLVMGDSALVRFRLRSLDQLATIPLAFLDTLSSDSGQNLI